MAQAVYISTDLVNGPLRASALGLPFFNAAGWNTAWTPPCVVIEGGSPEVVQTISDNPQTNAAAVQAALAPLIAQEITADNTAQANVSTIQANLVTQLAQIETWITNNPSGGTLNAAQTLDVARMLAGITRILIGLTSTIGGS